MSQELLWRVRKEDSAERGKAIRLSRLSQGIIDGVWSETDEALAPGDTQWRLIGEQPQLAEFVPRKSLFRSRDVEEAEMDMTPMIDVTFQLLIFFMIAATYIVQKTLDMPRPEQNQEGASAITLEELEKNNIMVKVSRDGSITVQKAPVERAKLIDALRQAVKQSDGAELVLDVDDEVDHETVVQVIDAAGAAQIEKVQFVSRVGSPSPDKGARVTPRYAPESTLAVIP